MIAYDDGRRGRPLTVQQALEGAADHDSIADQDTMKA
jgi:hypothetical protein